MRIKLAKVMVRYNTGFKTPIKQVTLKIVVHFTIALVCNSCNVTRSMPRTIITEHLKPFRYVRRSKTIARFALSLQTFPSHVHERFSENANS